MDLGNTQACLCPSLCTGKNVSPELFVRLSGLSQSSGSALRSKFPWHQTLASSPPPPNETASVYLNRSTLQPEVVIRQLIELLPACSFLAEAKKHY